MTLDGARKALRRHRADEGVPREVELMERLQRIRSLLVEVREELKDGPVGAYTERVADVPEEVESHPVAVAEAGAVEEPAVEKDAAEETVRAEVVRTASSEVEEEQPANPVSGEESAQQRRTSRPNRRPRRRKDDDDNNELFAFYEQSLF